MKLNRNNGLKLLRKNDLVKIKGGYIHFLSAALTYFAIESATNYRSSYNSFMKGWNDG